MTRSLVCRRRSWSLPLAAVPPGVLIRHGTSPAFPARIPDLIGVKDRAYLDATGLVRHRGIGDLMRYAASNQTVDMLARYGTFIPAGIGQRNRPEPGRGRFVGTRDRYTDVQLYALSMYLYSLEPPPNPHPLDARARGGQAVFERLRCGLCHTPPLYTNNALLPVAGFNPPPEHRERYDILDVPLGTDPGLTLTTRRGTGYYKVPSLKGVWYRGRSSTTAQSRRSKIGSIRLVSEPTIVRPGSSGWTGGHVPSRGTDLVCR